MLRLIALIYHHIGTLAAIALLSALTSCVPDIDIGTLYGQWQVTAIEQGGQTTTPAPVYLAFQNDCVFARIGETDAHFSDQFTGGFRTEGDSIFIHFYIDEDNPGAAVAHSYLSERFLFPEPHDDIRFAIKQNDSSWLILTQGNTLWRLRSY